MRSAPGSRDETVKCNVSPRALSAAVERRHRQMKTFTAAVTRLLSWLPLRAGRGCAAWLGRLMDALGTRAASVTRINLARCFPGLDGVALTRLARRSLGHTSCLVFESGPLAHWPGERLAKLVVSERGREQLTARRKDGRPSDGRPSDGGVLMLVPHFGNWEFICYVLGSLQFVALFDPPRVRALKEPLRRSRERFGARLLPANAGGLRAAYRQLRGGGLVCLLPDQVPEFRGGAYAPFFRASCADHDACPSIDSAHAAGRDARQRQPRAGRVQPGLRTIGAKTSTQARQPHSHKRSTRPSRNSSRRDPAQYQWEYKRFKKQRQGQPPVYPKR